jgi:hypothetical protein
MSELEQPSPQNQGAPATADMPAEPSGPTGLTAEAVLGYLKANPDTLKEDHIYEVPWLRSRVDSVISKRDAELKKQHEERVQRAEAERQRAENERLEAQRTIYTVENAYPNAEQALAALRANPDLAEAYARSKKLLAAGPPAQAAAVADQIWSKARKHLEEKYGYDLSGAGTLEEAFETMSEGEKSKAIKDLEKTFDEKFKALETQFRGMLNITADQPERGTSQGAGSGKRVWTAQEVESLSVEDWRKHEADIEEAVREGRIR